MAALKSSAAALPGYLEYLNGHRTPGHPNMWRLPRGCRPSPAASGGTLFRSTLIWEAQLTIGAFSATTLPPIDKLFLDLAAFVQEVKDETEFIRNLDR